MSEMEPIDQPLGPQHGTTQVRDAIPQAAESNVPTAEETEKDDLLRSWRTIIMLLTFLRAPYDKGKSTLPKTVQPLPDLEAREKAHQNVLKSVEDICTREHEVLSAAASARINFVVLCAPSNAEEGADNRVVPDVDVYVQPQSPTWGGGERDFEESTDNEDHEQSSTDNDLSMEVAETEDHEQSTAGDVACNAPNETRNTQSAYDPFDHDMPAEDVGIYSYVVGKGVTFAQNNTEYKHSHYFALSNARYAVLARSGESEWDALKRIIAKGEHQDFSAMVAS
jgi:hypothetical protein